ncbi:hypothetical protein GIB67_018843 [Kingdonia uniflora]|uniref:Uncharacterized protein n=1 Tax=Kingdonia uniflora TaxID=39325 RepID=A0A7J7NDU1_9MAGN|nr:hypothetical protein GIB67_018843 [Kingdonia uniflora]
MFYPSQVLRLAIMPFCVWWIVAGSSCYLIRRQVGFSPDCIISTCLNHRLKLVPLCLNKPSNNLCVSQLIAEATKQISGSQKRENDLYPMEYKVFDADVDSKMASLFSTDISEWAQLLEPIKKPPKNVGIRIRNCVNDALNKDPQEWARETLENSINTEVYKGKASGPIKKYDTTKVLTPHYDLNIAANDNYGKLYLSLLFALSIGSGFARFTAILTHVALFHGGDILKQSKMAMKSAKLDIHARLMKKYKDVTQWWFHEINIVKCL